MILKPIEEELVGYIFKLQGETMGIMTLMVMLKAMSLIQNLHEKSRAAQYDLTWCFIISLNLMY